MPGLDHDRFCDEIVAQTDLLGDVLSGADLSATVPTTPDWTLADLVRHIGGNLSSLEQAVRTGTAVTEPEQQVPGHGGPAGDDPAALDAWLSEAAGRCAATLREAGPDAKAQMWTVRWPAAAWARRAANDLVIHRADAAG
ncbi:MAG TPA: maleylpyruvate isomerase N-terminal domain-containing protein, partial [Actinomycetota bacterium]|nr:maleylpyruvate isomerase N-terminal domain-containing protein [Actinomycetota bacterium]